MRARIRNSTGIAVAFTALMTSLRALAQDGYTPEFNFPHTLTLKWEIVVLKKGDHAIQARLQVQRMPLR
jgi:hypothetical protein